MRRACPFLALVLTLAPTARAQVAPEHRATVEFRMLERATTFTSDQVGFGGDLPVTVQALRLLVARPDAAAVLVDLARVAWHPAGRLYALAGLRVVDPDAFAREARVVGSAGGEVAYFSGCLRGPSRVEVLVRNLEEGPSAEALCRPASATPALTIDEACSRLLREEGAQWEAIRALIDHGSAAVPALRATLRDEAPRRRAGAAWALEGLGPLARPALADLVAAVGDPDDDVAEAALDALEGLGPWAAEAAAEVHDMVTRAALPPRHLTRAVLLLERLVREQCLVPPERAPGFAAAAAVGEDDEDTDYLYARRPRCALIALPVAAIAPLTRALGDRLVQVRRDAHDALARWTTGPAAMAALEGALHEPDPDVRERLVDVLGEIGSRPDDRARVIAVLDRLAGGDPDPDVRARAAHLRQEVAGE
ncbi:MAG: HEAT repeat domain-containing protein [Planctomycetota bacterium]|nr:HEAT repeat domain-containing protein [Planctomycetota bacterium]